MQINSNNAAVVAMIFAALADERYGMRTLPAIRKASIPSDATPEHVSEIAETLTDAAIVNTVTELGMRLRRRLRDNAILIERPVPAAEALEISAKAQLVAAETAEPFELDFSPPAPALDAAAEHEVLDLEGRHAMGESILSADEDDEFRN